jgi:hypothetical protein
MELSSDSIDFFKPLSLNHPSFQDHLYISPINPICILITLYRNGIFFNKAIRIQRLLFLFSSDHFHFHHVIFPVKWLYSMIIYSYLLMVCLLVILLYSNRYPNVILIK